MSFIRPDPYGSSVLCVLFADVSGSTHLFEALGDIEASGVIRNCLKHMNAATESFGGRAIQPVGDGLMIAFPTPEFGMEAADDMMRRIQREPRVAGQHLAVRIGFHYGPVIVRTSNIFGGQLNIFGDTVNTAARIAALAKARQILTSAETLKLLPMHWQQTSRNLDAFTLKGKSEDLQIYEILWQTPDNMTLIRPSPLPPDNTFKHLNLRHLQQKFVLDANLRSLILGRNPTNDIIFEDQCISRQHAKIERRRNKFVLVDTSTNGTFVTFEGNNEIPVHMEELVLYGQGHISLGQPYDTAYPTGTLEFEIL